MNKIIKKIKKIFLEVERIFLIASLRFRNRPYKILEHHKMGNISKPVTVFDKKFRHQVQRMNSTLNNQRWGMKLGIAAPQVGINKRFFIAMGKLYVNPEWTPTRAPKESVTEGCYSVGHDKLYKVPRSKYGWAKWQNSNGDWAESKIRGLDAIVFQHELDHLNGKCCCDTGKLISPKKD